MPGLPLLTMSSAPVLLLLALMLFVALSSLSSPLVVVGEAGCLNDESLDDKETAFIEGAFFRMVARGAAMVGLPQSSILSFTGTAGEGGVYSPWVASMRPPGSVAVLLPSCMETGIGSLAAAAGDIADASDPDDGRCSKAGTLGTELRMVGFDSIGGRGRAARSGWRSVARVRALRV